MVKRKVTIINKLGLHARAAAKFVNYANQFASKIEITKDSKTVNGKSIMGVMMLAAAQGSQLLLIAEGQDEQQAISALHTLIDNKFEEEE